VEHIVGLRFARARQGDFSQAKRFLQADLAWRAQKTPVMQDDCPTALASGVWRVLGCTASGLPVVLIQQALWDPTQSGVDEWERFVIYFCENMVRMGRGEPLLMISDQHGWKLSHVAHMRKIARLVSTVKDQPYTTNPKHQTSTLNPKPQTLYPKP